MAQFNYGVSVPQSVGGYLKRKLKKRNVTQEEFSYEFGVDVRTVRRWVSVKDTLSYKYGVNFYLRKK